MGFPRWFIALLVLFGLGVFFAGVTAAFMIVQVYG